VKVLYYFNAMAKALDQVAAAVVQLVQKRD
jgi:hypothetical protein